MNAHRRESFVAFSVNMFRCNYQEYPLSLIIPEKVLVCHDRPLSVVHTLQVREAEDRLNVAVRGLGRMQIPIIFLPEVIRM